VSTYASGLLNYTPSGVFPGSGEQGLTGIAVDPVTHDVFVSHLWQTSGNNFPRITRLTSLDGGLTSSSRSVILDMPGEAQGQSHQISRLEIVNGELFAHMGDGMVTSTGTNLFSYRGKILRMNLDGSPVTSNPFYNGGVRDSMDYIYAYGLRNPFGGAWRALDGFRYEVENGPEVDRFAKLVMGRNYGWDGSNASMYNFAAFVWNPSCGPVNLAFVQPQTFNGSGFPPSRMDHAFVTESGATYAEGQQSIGKRISEFTLDAAGNVLTGPVPFAEYVGDGYATAVGLAAGPDGLYYTELYRDLATTGPSAAGGRILRIRAGDPQDCNGNGLADWCEIANGALADCNGNQVPDACDIANGTSHDFDHNGRPDECDPLSESTDHLSLSTGGRVDFTLNADTVNAGMLYFLLGSMSGTSPGTQFGAVTLPLNSVNDPWFQLTSTLFNPAMLQNTLGFLDAQGRGTAALVTPPLPPSLLGLPLHHAYLVVDLGALQVRTASNAMPLVLTL
jgi:glucose/arabinose dehydrogenase